MDAMREQIASGEDSHGPTRITHRYDIMSYRSCTMAKTKVAVTIDGKLLNTLDDMIAKRQFPNRSQAMEIALAEKLERLGRSRLARECAKLNPREEKQLADEGLGDPDEWPAY